MRYTEEEVIDQLQYEVEELAQYGFKEEVNLNEIESLEIAKLIYTKDKKIKHLFSEDPEIVLKEIDNDTFDWADIHQQILDVIEWYKLNPLVKMFQPGK